MTVARSKVAAHTAEGNSPPGQFVWSHPMPMIQRVGSWATSGWATRYDLILKSTSADADGLDVTKLGITFSILQYHRSRRSLREGVVPWRPLREYGHGHLRNEIEKDQLM